MKPRLYHLLAEMTVGKSFILIEPILSAKWSCVLLHGVNVMIMYMQCPANTFESWLCHLLSFMIWSKRHHE